MAQPTALQADVNLRTIRPGDVTRPVETRRGEVRSITLTIPLLTERNSYLVVRLPDQVVQDLLRHVRTLPGAQRADYLREWVMRNQEAVLDQYVRSGTRTRRFRYNVVPVQAIPTLAETTPRRVEPSAPPAAATVPRREGGRVIQPGATVQPPPVSTGEVREGPVVPPAPPRAREAQEERELEGGTGTRADPYRIRVLRNRSRRADIGSREVAIPITITGVGHFRVSVTLSQVTRANFETTYREALRLCRQAFLQSEAGRGAAVRFQAPPFTQLRDTVWGQLRQDPALRRYLDTQ